jgi:hypothetical protein
VSGLRQLVSGLRDVVEVGAVEGAGPGSHRCRLGSSAIPSRISLPAAARSAWLSLLVRMRCSSTSRRTRRLVLAGLRRIRHRRCRCERRSRKVGDVVGESRVSCQRVVVLVQRAIAKPAGRAFPGPSSSPWRSRTPSPSPTACGSRSRAQRPTSTAAAKSSWSSTPSRRRPASPRASGPGSTPPPVERGVRIAPLTARSVRTGLMPIASPQTLRIDRPPPC